MRHDEVADPLGHGRPPARDGVLAYECFVKRPPLGAREAKVRSVLPGVRYRWSSQLGHGVWTS
jgi:hypothetical protein